MAPEPRINGTRCDEQELEHLFCGPEEALARSALGELLRRHRQELGRLASSRCRTDKHLSEDVLQEAATRMWKGRQSFDPTKGRWITWANAILCHISSDAHRKRFPRPATDVSSAEDPPGEGLLERVPGHDLPPDLQLKLEDLQGALAACLARLPAEERVVLTLKLLEGLTFAEIAERLGVPPGTVASRYYRAGKKMAACLKSKGYGDCEP